jgi:hypothetical protein
MADHEIMTGLDCTKMRMSDCGRISSIDFVAWAAKQSRKQASQTLINLAKKVDKDTEVLLYPWVGELKKCEFAGSLNKTSSLDIDDANHLMMILNGNKATQFREAAAKTIGRFFAGDPTLKPEIDANAKSDGPVQQLARVSHGGKAVQDTEEDKYQDDMIEVNGGFELTIVKYRNEIDVLNSAIEDRANAFQISTDHAHENHELVRHRMLKLNKETYDMCMEDDNTEEEKAELLRIFTTKKSDILNDNLDQHSTKKAPHFTWSL